MAGLLKAIMPGLLMGVVAGGCSKAAEADYNTLEYRGGLAHVPGSETPFSGRAVSRYANGQEAVEVVFEKGLEEGLEVAWYQDGQKQSEGTRKKGEWDGVLTHWYPDGTKMAEYTYVAGELTGRKDWDEKGRPLAPATKAPPGK